MRVLLISHTVFSKTGNMGKTLMGYFEKFGPEEIAQLYVHSEVPTEASACHRYFRFTDKDALKSVFLPRVQGREFGLSDIDRHRETPRTDRGVTKKLYQIGARRTPMIFALRNAVWKLSRWNNEKLRGWVRDFDPDVVCFAAGDYGFMYDVTKTIAAELKKPLVVICVDDFYIYNKNTGSAVGRMVHRDFMRSVHRTMAAASEIFTICQPMQEEYGKLFGKPCRVLHTPASRQSVPVCPEARQISYIGNLEPGRYLPLVELGQALGRIQDPRAPRFIDVYSTEENPSVLKYLTEENGIRFHGAVSARQVQEIFGSSMAVIHTESFDPEIRQRTRLSVSTKIPESMMNGPCLIAYGPEGIASVDYLKANNAAYVITDRRELDAGLREILTHEQLRRDIVTRARALAEENHSVEVNPARVRLWLEGICGAQEEQKLPVSV